MGNCSHSKGRTDATKKYIFLQPVRMYANNKYFVEVASHLFTNLNAIKGWGRGDFRTVSYKEMTRITIHFSYPYMNGMLSTVIDMSIFRAINLQY